MPNAGSNISGQIQEIARNIKIELRARAHPIKLSLKRRRTSEVYLVCKIQKHVCLNVPSSVYVGERSEEYVKNILRDILRIFSIGAVNEPSNFELRKRRRSIL